MIDLAYSAFEDGNGKRILNKGYSYASGNSGVFFFSSLFLYHVQKDSEVADSN